MFGIDQISLSLSFSPYLLALAIILLILFTVFTYKYTIPKVSGAIKIFLIALRAAAILLLLFAIFEPVLTLSKKKIIEPVNLVFFDNSRSIVLVDSLQKVNAVNNFYKDLQNSGLENFENFKFGENVSSVDEISQAGFSERRTNFSKIFEKINSENKNISSVVILSDGIITEGATPVYQAERSGIPVYTISLGDTSRKNNIEIIKIITNEILYPETPSTINAAISSTGFNGKTAKVNLFEEGKLIDSKDIELNSGRTTNVNLSYTPKSSGEKKLLLTVTEFEGESNFADNKKNIYINVLDNKINVLAIAGSPSPDLSFVLNSLKQDENLKVNSLTQISQNSFLEKADVNKLIDSAEVLYLIGFPSNQTSQNILNKVNEVITKKRIPFFFIASATSDFSKLKTLQDELPFTILNASQGFTEVRANIDLRNSNDPLMKTSNQNSFNEWNNLPPVLRTNSSIQPKPESKVLATVLINNIPINNPLIVTRRLGKSRSAAILGKDIWRWKLQRAENQNFLFDNFILNSVKWLNTNEEQKSVSIRPVRKVFSLGEQVDFIAQVYDETLSPVSDAEVSIKISGKGEVRNLSFSPLGNGLYEASIQNIEAGDYDFSGFAKLTGTDLGSDKGKFTINEIDIEMISKRTDNDFLNLLANQTGGKYFHQDNYSQIFDILKNNSAQRSKEKIERSEFVLWSNELLLVLIILLLAVEWFIRKRSGMV